MSKRFQTLKYSIRKNILDRKNLLQHFVSYINFKLSFGLINVLTKTVILILDTVLLDLLTELRYLGRRNIKGKGHWCCH